MRTFAFLLLMICVFFEVVCAISLYQGIKIQDAYIILNSTILCLTFAINGVSFYFHWKDS